MNDKFETQKEKLLSIKHEISLLYQQVNYLIRNGKALELLDLDVLMNRTHTLYDMLCSISLGDETVEEDLPFDADALSGLFGGMMQEEVPEENQEENEEPTETEPVAPVEVPQTAVMEQEPMIEPQEEVQEVAAETTVVEMPQLVVETETPQPIEEAPQPVGEAPLPEVQPIAEEPPVAEEQSAEEPPADEKPLGDEFGFFFRFEDFPEKEPTETSAAAPEPEPEPEPEPAKTEGKVVHVMEEVPMDQIPERDRVHGEDLVKDNPLEMPKMEYDPFGSDQFDYEKRASEAVSDYFGHDDTGFELSMPETLGDRMMHEDNSLAAKLQQNPIHDLKSAIGINDKFLFVNELFGGSMEKYNKSIENLNDLKTLNGAMIYLNELKIELQWNSSNEAYQKLKDLVSKKFN